MSAVWTGHVNLDEAVRKLTEAARAGMKDAGDDLLTRSQALVPTDTGALRASGSVKVDGDTVTVGYDARYAVPVHERTENRHDDGQAKFLEQPFLETDKVAQVLAQRIQQDMA